MIASANMAGRSFTDVATSLAGLVFNPLSGCSTSQAKRAFSVLIVNFDCATLPRARIEFADAANVVRCDRSDDLAFQAGEIDQARSAAIRPRGIGPIISEAGLQKLGARLIPVPDLAGAMRRACLGGGDRWGLHQGLEERNRVAALAQQCLRAFGGLANEIWVGQRDDRANGEVVLLALHATAERPVSAAFADTDEQAGDDGIRDFMVARVAGLHHARNSREAGLGDFDGFALHDGFRREVPNY